LVDNDDDSSVASASGMAVLLAAWDDRLRILLLRGGMFAERQKGGARLGEGGAGGGTCSMEVGGLLWPWGWK
jgi:hypothetical protein